MVVVDHDSGRLVWAAAGHDKKTLGGFFDLVGEERCQRIRLVSAHAAEWIGETVAERCKSATLCLDGFHIVGWATDALDVVRRLVWNDARRCGLPGQAAQLKGCRYALWKNNDDLTGRQMVKLAWIAKHNNRLYRAYLLKEELRLFRRQRRSRDQDAAFLAGLGGALSDRTVRRARQTHPQEPGRDRGRPPPRPVQRSHRIDQHQDPAAHPHGLRVRQSRRPDRPRPPRPRRLLPTLTRAERPELGSHPRDSLRPSGYRAATTNPAGVGQRPRSTHVAAMSDAETNTDVGRARSTTIAASDSTSSSSR
jgi:Transposase